MAAPPRPVRALPNTPSQDSDEGITTGLVTRIVIVATVVLGQLFALTVALEASLVDHDRSAWLLAGFSLVSFVVVLVLTRVDPPPRAVPRPGRADEELGLYVARPIEPRFDRGDADPPPR